MIKSVDQTLHCDHSLERQFVALNLALSRVQGLIIKVIVPLSRLVPLSKDQDLFL